MCDYSLMMAPSRLAVEGEELVTHKFKSGSIGIVSCCDFDRWTTRRPRSFWQWLKDGFSSPNEPGPVVCIPPGARLQLIGIPETLKTEISTGLCEDVVFTQISADPNQHRDALFFANGVTVLLQRLPEGQRLKVQWMSSLEDSTLHRDRSEIAQVA